jgi:alkylation response protein AidB-like acyl-CoA dehydrogenase
LGVRSPSRYGSNTKPSLPTGADNAKSDSSSGVIRSSAAAMSSTRAALSVHTNGKYFGKLHNVQTALEVARTARTILGANGITLEYPVMRHMANLESVLTHEGTSEIHPSWWARPSPESRHFTN